MEPEFKLEFLPPYTPDMNPVEWVWKLTRRLSTHTRTLDKNLPVEIRLFQELVDEDLAQE